MEFSNIRLTNREHRLLLQSMEKPVDVNAAPRLLRLKLTYEEVTHIPGYAPKATGLMSITNLGRDYLIYCRQRKKELWLKNAWIPILVTIVTNLIIDGLKCLSPQIQQWLSSIP